MIIQFPTISSSYISTSVAAEYRTQRTARIFHEETVASTGLYLGPNSLKNTHDARKKHGSSDEKPYHWTLKFINTKGARKVFYKM